MFGVRYIKVQPTTYLLVYRNGRIAREGAGLALFYYAPTTSLVAVPLESTDAPFIFEETTADFQSVTIQGQVMYRVADAKRLASLMNFTLDASGRRYVSDDPQKLPQRVVNVVKIIAQAELQQIPLRQALRAANRLTATLREQLRASEEITRLGLEVLGLSILAIKPTPETARALEAEAREQLLGEADEAIYARRNAAVEQERAIKENELNTDIAVENKKRQIREAQMDADSAVQEKRHQIEQADVEANTRIEHQRGELVQLGAENSRVEADARTYALQATMKTLGDVDPRVLQALASVGMKPDQLIALAFQGLADRADKIGELNVSPELLSKLLSTRK